jgi:hypothetical protein
MCFRLVPIDSLLDLLDKLTSNCSGPPRVPIVLQVERAAALQILQNIPEGACKPVQPFVGICFCAIAIAIRRQAESPSEELRLPGIFWSSDLSQRQCRLIFILYFLR